MTDGVVSIVLIEDDEDDYIITRDMLEEIRNVRFDLTWVSSPEKAVEVLRKPPPKVDLYLIDYRLGVANGLELAKGALSAGLRAPVILLTGRGSHDIDVAAMQAGVADYLIKGEINSAILERSIRYAIERKIAERAIRQAEARYRTLVEQMPVVTYQIMMDHSMAMVYVSPQIEALTGYRTDEWLDEPRTWFEHVHPEDKSQVTIAMEQSRLTGTELDIEYRMVSRAGAVVWVHDRGQYVLGERRRRSNILQGVLSDITGRKEAESRIAVAKSRAEAMVRTASRLSAALDIATVIHTVCEEAARAIGVPAAAVALTDKSRKILEPAAVYGLPSGIASELQSVTIKDFEKSVAETGQGLLFAEARTEAALLAHGVRSTRTVGMKHGGKLIGALSVYDTVQDRSFGHDEDALLHGIADQASQAVMNAKLFAETRQRLERMQAVQAVEAAITSSFDLRLSIGVLCSQVRGSLSADAVAVHTVNKSNGMLELVAAQGFRTDFADDELFRMFDRGLLGKVSTAEKPKLVTELAELPALAETRRYLEEEGFHSCVSVPLVAKSKLEGVLVLFQRSKLEPDKEWMDFLETLCHQAALAIDGTVMFEDLQRSNEELVQAYDATIVGWSRALDLRDEETEGHTRRVTEMAEKLARRFGFGDHDLVQVRRGALLHDIGKMGVPDAILLKPGPLTPDEWVIMKKHPQYAYDMLYPILYLRPALDIPYCHHEKWDGSGYPRGLRGTGIPIAARLFAVVDVWDALRSDRPYRAAWSLEKVRDHIQQGSGSHFDPDVVDAFMDVIE